MTAKWIKTIFPLKFSSKGNYRIYWQQRNITAIYRSVKNDWKYLHWTGSLACINTWTDRASFTQRKWTYIHFAAWIRLTVSACNSFSSSWEEWEFGSWLGGSWLSLIKVKFILIYYPSSSGKTFCQAFSDVLTSDRIDGKQIDCEQSPFFYILGNEREKSELERARSDDEAAIHKKLITSRRKSRRFRRARRNSRLRCDVHHASFFSRLFREILEQTRDYRQIRDKSRVEWENYVHNFLVCLLTRWLKRDYPVQGCHSSEAE